MSDKEFKVNQIIWFLEKTRAVQGRIQSVRNAPERITVNYVNKSSNMYQTIRLRPDKIYETEADALAALSQDKWVTDSGGVMCLDLNDIKITIIPDNSCHHVKIQTKDGLSNKWTIKASSADDAKKQAVSETKRMIEDNIDQLNDIKMSLDTELSKQQTH